MRYVIAALVILLITSGTTIAKSTASPDIEQVIRQAVKHSRYSEPVRMPRVIEITDQQVGSSVPAMKGRLTCGYYDNHNKTLYINRTLKHIDEDNAFACWVHEAVHYLQDLAGRSFKTCIGRRLLEAEAYHVQREYLSSKGVKPKGRWRPANHRCNGK